MRLEWMWLPAYLAALGTGCMAGTFFVFSACVVRALSRLSASQSMAAMQSINGVIVRSAFLPVFLGTALACVLASGIALWRTDAGGVAVIAGSALYLAGVLGVTMVFNVPHNDALAAVDPTSADAARLWADYVARWVPWNTVRTVSATAALAAFLLAMRG